MPLGRYRWQFVAYQERQAVATGLKASYHAPTQEAAARALEDCAAQWEAKEPLMIKSWRAHWERRTPMFSYLAARRKIVDTTHAIESLHRSVRKMLKNRAACPSPEAAYKLRSLALQNIAPKWTMPLQDWARVRNQLALLLDGRLSQQPLSLTQNF